MSSFDVLNRNVDVLGHRLLEASAGTGKTFAIEHLVVRLILEKAVALNTILVMTFTRAATRELKMRIRATLQSASVQLERGELIWDYLQAIKNPEEAQRLLHESLSLFDEAQIFTIHGFCHKLLQEFAFEAGVPFNFKEPSEKEEHSKDRACILDFFRTSLKWPRYGAAQVDALLKKYRMDSGALADKILSLIEKPLKQETFSNFEACFCEFSELVKKTPVFDAELAIRDFPKIAAEYKRVDLRKQLKQYSSLVRCIERRTCTPQEYDQLLGELHNFFEIFQLSNLKKRAQVREVQDPKIFPLLQQLYAPHVQKATDPLKILLRMIQDCQKSFEKETLSFDGLLYKVEENLKNPDFCKKARGHFQALIVDEFQDTDPLQWKIFQEIFFSVGTSPSAVYLVGDPKQSIYRFRGADVYTYLKAGELLQEKSHLATNFRSTSSLVKALNLLFSTQKLKLPQEKRMLDFLPVQSQDASSARPFLDQKGSVHFFSKVSKKGREKSWPTHEMEEEAFFPFIAQEIEELLPEGRRFSERQGQGSPVRIPPRPSPEGLGLRRGAVQARGNQKLKEIAILVKDWAQAQRIQKFLLKAGIPAFCARGKDLAETLGFFAIKQLLEALQNPEFEKNVLLGPFFNLSQKDLQSQDFYQLRKLFSEFMKKGVQKNNFALFFSNFLNFSWKGTQVLQNVLLQKDFYSELKSVVEVLTSSTNSPIEELLIRLKELQKERTEMQSLMVEDGVVIQTIHGSKGLEFEIVFALGVSSRHLKQDEWILLREEQQEKLEVFDEEHPESILYLRELDAEKMRQLYVALTRAKKRVYIPLALEEEKSAKEAGSLSPIELFFSEIVPTLDNDGIFQVLDEFSKTADITVQKLIQPIVLEPWTLEKRIKKNGDRPLKIPGKAHLLLSFSSLAKKSEVLLEPAEALEKEKSFYSLPRGAETGIILHQILEKSFKRGLFLKEQSEKRANLIHSEMKHSSLVGWEEIVRQMIDEILALPLTGPDGIIHLADLHPKKVLQELGFIFSSKDQFIKGFADLIFEWRGKYYLVDWKSNWLGRSQEAYVTKNLEKAMIDHDYFLQADIYATAFRKFVKLFDTRPFEELFGGAFYVFLRGPAAYFFTPSSEKFLC